MITEFENEKMNREKTIKEINSSITLINTRINILQQAKEFHELKLVVNDPQEVNE